MNLIKTLQPFSGAPKLLQINFLEVPGSGCSLSTRAEPIPTAPSSNPTFPAPQKILEMGCKCCILGIQREKIIKSTGFGQLEFPILHPGSRGKDESQFRVSFQWDGLFRIIQDYTGNSQFHIEKNWLFSSSY